MHIFWEFEGVAWHLSWNTSDCTGSVAYMGGILKTWNIIMPKRKTI